MQCGNTPYNAVINRLRQFVMSEACTWKNLRLWLYILDEWFQGVSIASSEMFDNTALHNTASTSEAPVLVNAIDKLDSQ